jgi:hypothetical protein
MTCHSALYDSVAQVESPEVVASVSQYERFEVSNAWSLVGEELILESFLAKSFVGVYGK